jgi:hypothetical protein
MRNILNTVYNCGQHIGNVMGQSNSEYLTLKNRCIEFYFRSFCIPFFCLMLEISMLRASKLYYQLQYKTKTKQNAK